MPSVASGVGDDGKIAPARERVGDDGETAKRVGRPCAQHGPGPQGNSRRADAEHGTRTIAKDEGVNGVEVEARSNEHVADTGENLFAYNGADQGMVNIYNNPAFLRMYWRALRELVNGPLNVANSGPLLEAKYNAFTANGLNVEDPDTNIEPWRKSLR